MTTNKIHKTVETWLTIRKDINNVDDDNDDYDDDKDDNNNSNVNNNKNANDG